MLEFEANAARLRGLLTAEAKGNERDPEVDAGLSELRAAWKRLPAEDRALAGEISASLKELVEGRPAAQNGNDPGPEESPLPEPPTEAELRMNDQHEARLALQGLDGLTKVAATETRSYVAHHLALAGRADTLFSDDAIGLIHEVSRGLPRQVNNLAVAALIAAFAAKKAIVDESAARVAVAEISSE